MPTAAILGARDTRVRRPSTACSRTRARARRPRLGLARRQPASALDPRLNGDLPPFVTNAEALAAGADVVFVCLGHEEAAALEPPDAEVVVDLSGAHRLRDASLYAEWYGFEHPRPAPGATACRSSSARAAARREPRLLRDAALLALAPLARRDRADERRRRREVGRLGRGPRLKASSHAGFVLENLSPYRVGTHQHAPEIEQALGFPVCFVPHLLPVRRGLLVTCYVQPLADCARCSRTRTRRAVVRVLDEGVTPELSRVQHTDAAEIALYEDRATGARSSSARSTTSARARPATPCRTRTSRSARRDRGPAADGSARMSVTAAKGFTASGVAARISKLGPTSRSSSATASASAPAMFTANRVQARRSSSARSTSRAAAAGRRDQLRERERRDRRAGLADARATRARRRACSGSSPSRCSSSRPA
jgi:N-acetyl-gamma-glutamyl-phosphate reductase